MWKNVQGWKGGIAFGDGMEGVTLMEEVGECVKYWMGKWWQRRKKIVVW